MEVYGVAGWWLFEHEDFLSYELNLNQISHLFKQKLVLFNSLERLCVFFGGVLLMTLQLLICELWIYGKI